MDTQSFDTAHVKHIIEAALLTAAEPLQLSDLKKDRKSTRLNSSH